MLFFVIICYVAINMYYFSFPLWCSSQIMLDAIDSEHFSYSFFCVDSFIAFLTNTVWMHDLFS